MTIKFRILCILSVLMLLLASCRSNTPEARIENIENIEVPVEHDWIFPGGKPVKLAVNVAAGRPLA